MAEESENVRVGGDFSLHLVFDLGAHKSEFFLSFMGMQVSSYINKLEASLLNFATSNQLPWGVRHKSCEADEEDDSPWNLNAQWQSPLNGPVRRVGTSKADPIRYHCSEADTTSRDTCDEATMLGRRDLAQIDGYGAHHTTNSVSSKHSAGEKHSHIHGAGLNSCSNGDDDAQQLHESDSSKPIACTPKTSLVLSSPRDISCFYHTDDCLRESPTGFTSNVHRNDSTRKPIRRMVHVIDPTVVSNRCRCYSRVESEEKGADGCEQRNAKGIPPYRHLSLLNLGMIL